MGKEQLTDKIHDMEDHSQEGPTQQVSQSCEVGDGAVVRVDPSGPHAVHHHAGQVEQQADLGENTSLSKINTQRGGGGGLPAELQR